MFDYAAWDSWSEIEAKGASAVTLGDLYKHLEHSAKPGDVASLLRSIPEELARVADFIDGYRAEGSA